MRKLLRLLGLLTLLVGAIVLAKELSAQTATAKTPTKSEAAAPKIDVEALVAKEFGEDYKVASDVPAMFGDFDGDGIQDVAVVATGKNPLMGEGLHNYKILDPYNESFGYGNPKVTMSFNTDSTKARYILIAHDAQSPKAKFVLVNVSFVKIRMGHMLKKKKPIAAIEVTDETGVVAAVFFTGKKYKWEIIGSDADR